MAPASAYETVLHVGLRKRWSTPSRAAFLAVFFASATLVVFYLPQLLTGLTTFEGARDECRDGTCMERFDATWYTHDSGTAVGSSEAAADADDFVEAKVVCRRSAFCAAIMESPLMAGTGNPGNDAWMFSEARNVCRDAHCLKKTVPWSERVHVAFLKVSKTLTEIFSVEMEVMQADLDEGLAEGRDRAGKLSAGVHSYPMLEMIERQVSGSSISLVHWHALESVHRVSNDAEWTAGQLDRLLAQSVRWEAEKSNLGGTTAEVRADILSSVLGELGLPLVALQTLSTCSESCDTNWDGVCDDGGSQSGNDSCDFGTDCLVSSTLFSSSRRCVPYVHK
jgi:hypothetical protein